VLEGARRVGTVPTALQPGGIAPTDGGRAVAVVTVRARELEVFDATSLRRTGEAAAGVGPTHVVGDGNYLYVADTQGGALLVFRILPTLHLTRRYPLPGSPYGLAVDHVHGRIWVTLTARNEVVEMTVGARPHVIARLPTPRQPNSVAVEPRSGRALVAGKADGVLQLLDPPRTR
jgi:DNA-binding beta-propeller fold protein YncE